MTSSWNNIKSYSNSGTFWIINVITNLKMEVIAQGEGIVLTGFSWKLLRFYTEYTNHVIGYRYLMIKKKSLIITFTIIYLLWLGICIKSYNCNYFRERERMNLAILCKFLIYKSFSSTITNKWFWISFQEE